MRKVLFWIGVFAVALALCGVAWCSYQIRHQCVKQCDWGDKQCADMCGKRNFCPAHPDGL